MVWTGFPVEKEERSRWVEGHLGLGLVGVGEQEKSRVKPGLEVRQPGLTGDAGVCRSTELGGGVNPVWGILGSGCHETLHVGADLGTFAV